MLPHMAPTFTMLENSEAWADWMTTVLPPSSSLRDASVNTASSFSTIIPVSTGDVNPKEYPNTKAPMPATLAAKMALAALAGCSGSRVLSLGRISDQRTTLAQRKIRNEKPEIRNDNTQYVFREANTYQIRTKWCI